MTCNCSCSWLVKLLISKSVGKSTVDGQNIAIETSDAVVNKKLPRLFFAEDIADIQHMQG